MKLFHNLFLSIILLTTAALSTAAMAVNINTASVEEIASGLNGIGENKARAIVQYRADHGKFKTLQELENVTGVGAKTVEKNKENISL